MKPSTREIYLLSNEIRDDVKNLNVIDIKYLNPLFSCSDYDAIIFTSKNSVFAAEKLDKSWKNLQIYSIGLGTSKAIIDLKGEVYYQAKESYGDKFAHEIAKYLQGKKVLFPHAKEVVSDVIGILKSFHVSVDEFVVYETLCNKCKQSQKPKDNSILIFTSPSTVKCFLQNFNWNDSFVAIAIGDKTARALSCDKKVHISPAQSIDSCVNFAKRLSKDFI